MTAALASDSQIPYRVLARKYRPTNFDDLIGQEVLVRTLSNAIANNRIAHGFLLTGIRGIGKTTTARIIARALNCETGPTISPCGVCSQCVCIGEDRNVDVIEMDAASHTGVDDVRDIIDSVAYLPVSSRYKIFIIDEVHMLSKNAFNALLKTLEEPPPHVKFIFATTEVRKIPVTILSRCQRFDLKRIDGEMLANHLQNICNKEQVDAQAEALKLIAVAAEGSVRDSLSLLDQAIARANPIASADVRLMLGAADNSVLFFMLEDLLKGEVDSALSQMRVLYNGGTDPLLMVQDLLELVHLISRMKINRNAVANDVTLPEHDRKKLGEFANLLSMPILARLWQMFLKGVNEVKFAPSPLSALEMLLIRIAYAADMPTPAELIRDGDSSVKSSPQAAPSAQAPREAAPVAQLVTQESPKDFAAFVDFFEKNREPLLALTLRDKARLVSYAQGTVVLSMVEPQPRDFTVKMMDYLKQWTGQSWSVTLRDDAQAATLREQEIIHTEELKEKAQAEPLVANLLEQFPGAKIVSVK